jgi:aryl-alcohol dehydrogenase-like predicted oxidoreductase
MSSESNAGSHAEVPRRALGRTGEMVSMVGLGGYHLGIPRSERTAAKIVHAAVDRGITFLDNSWDYHEGASEERMGAALAEGGYRDKVFLMTKVDGRTRRSAEKQLHQSLKRLRTDRIDLLQLHEVIRFEDADRAFDVGGAIEALVDAREAGKIRYIGFTGHKDPSVHLYMLDVARAHGFTFDTVQMPLNVMDAHFRSFEGRVLPTLVAQGIGVLGMKSMAAGKILKSGVVNPVECLHYALNLPTSVVITGIDKLELVEQAAGAAASFHPMTADDVARLLAKTAVAAREGRYESFKTSSEHDSTAKNVEWLG